MLVNLPSLAHRENQSHPKSHVYRLFVWERSCIMCVTEDMAAHIIYVKYHTFNVKLIATLLQ